MMRARAITAKRLFTKSWFYPVLLFFLVVLFKFPIIKTPHYWDALNRMHNVDWIKHHNFNPFLQLGDGPLNSQGRPPSLNSQGRPPFLLELLALTSAIAGSTIAIPHLVIIAFSYLGALYTYYLGLRLFGRQVGVLASLLLFLSPLYFAQSGIINYAVPLTALSTAAIFYALTENPKKYVFVASCLVLTQEPGILALLPILLIICARYYKTPHCIRKLCVYFLPFIMLALWLLACKVHLGWYLCPLQMRLFNFSRIPALFAAFINRTGQLLIANYHWLLSCFLVLGFILWWNTKRHKREIIFLICGEFIVYLLFFSIFSAEIPRYILPIYPLFYLASIKGMDLVFHGRKQLLVATVVVVVLIFCFQWRGNRAAEGFNLETNLEYMDFIDVHVRAAHYIEEHYSTGSILTTWPQTMELEYPFEGYVTRHIPTKSIFETYDVDEISMIYYIPNRRQELDDLIKRLPLKPLARFEKNSKYAVIYGFVRGPG